MERIAFSIQLFQRVVNITRGLGDVTFLKSFETGIVALKSAQAAMDLIDK
jgi:hypothetical protein